MTCEVCGPLANGHIHSICHVTPISRNGCGHALDDHTDGLKCRVCKQECGIYCRPGTGAAPAPEVIRHVRSQGAVPVDRTPTAAG